MAKQLWLNNFDTELTGVVKALPDTGSPATELGYGIIQLSGAMGTVLPALTGGDWFLLTLFKIVGGLEDDIEVVKVTSIDTSSGSETRLTVERGYEGTTVRAFAIGDKVSMRMTAGSADNFAQKSMNLDDIPDPATALANLGGEPAIAPPGSAPTEKFWRGDKTWADFATAVRATVLTGLSTATNAVITASDTVLTMAGKLQKQISDHFASTANAHPASAIDVAAADPPTSNSIPAGTVQALLAQNWQDVGGLVDWRDFHTSGAGTQHPASTISNTPAGGISATNVQAAIDELDSEKFAKTGGQISGSVGIGISPSAQLHVALISQITNDGVERKSFSSLTNSTNWLRLCSFNSNNYPGYTRFFVQSANHFHCVVEFSRGAGGDNIRAKMTVLGFYQSYASTMPLIWRIVGEGTNLPCHIDVKFGGGAAQTYTIREVENVHLGAWDSTARASFPCTDVGSATAGLEVSIGTSGGGLTHREIELVPGAWRKVGMNLQPVYGP